MKWFGRKSAAPATFAVPAWLAGDVAPAIETIRSSLHRLRGTLSLSYYDPDRDYQAGVARIAAAEAGFREEAVDLPIVLDAGEAKSLAERMFASRCAREGVTRLRLPPSRIGLRPGRLLLLPDRRCAKLVRSVEIEGMVVTVEAQDAAPPPALLDGDGGLALRGPDRKVGRTELAIFQLSGNAPSEGPGILVAGSCAGAWKPVPIDLDMSGQLVRQVTLSRRAALGFTQTALGPEADASLVVRMVDPESTLLSADPEALSLGANLSAIGDEVVQFGRARFLGDGQYELSHLVRGLPGGLGAALPHQAGQPFCLLDPSTLADVRLPASMVGQIVRAAAKGVADRSPYPAAERLLLAMPSASG